MAERMPAKPAAMFDLSGRVAIVTGASGTFMTGQMLVVDGGWTAH
jgi:hypothetical protein